MYSKQCILIRPKAMNKVSTAMSLEEENEESKRVKVKSKEQKYEQ